jgi:hypothetical protein
MFFAMFTTLDWTALAAMSSAIGCSLIGVILLPTEVNCIRGGGDFGASLR